MTNWLPIRNKGISEKRAERIRGHTFHVMVSPHDMPTDVRGYYDDKTNKIVLEFRYIDDEDASSPQQADPHIRLFTGKRSRRVKRLEIDAKSMDVDELDVKLHVVPDSHESWPQYAVGFFDKLRSNATSADARISYEIARNVIRSMGNEIAERIER